MDFINVLKEGNCDEIKNAIEDEQYEFYSSDAESKKINLGYSIPNYDILMNVLKCDDLGEPVINETFGDETYLKILTIYQTENIGVYFARIEEYGPADIDAMKCYIIITNDINEEAKKMINEYENKSVIKEQKENNK